MRSTSLLHERTSHDLSNFEIRDIKVWDRRSSLANISTSPGGNIWCPRWKIWLVLFDTVYWLGTSRTKSWYIRVFVQVSLRLSKTELLKIPESIVENRRQGMVDSVPSLQARARVQLKHTYKMAFTWCPQGAKGKEPTFCLKCCGGPMMVYMNKEADNKVDLLLSCFCSACIPCPCLHGMFMFTPDTSNGNIRYLRIPLSVCTFQACADRSFSPGMCQKWMFQRRRFPESKMFLRSWQAIIFVDVLSYSGFLGICNSPRKTKGIVVESLWKRFFCQNMRFWMLESAFFR